MAASEPAPTSTALRNAFLRLIDDETRGDKACELVAQLLDARDVLPQEYCDVLELAEGSTFGDAARKLAAELGCA